MSDPLNHGKYRLTSPSGAIAGIFSRIDEQRGVWKAPAGVQAKILAIQGLEVNLTHDQNNNFSSKGINCLRQFPARGTVIWGAQTLRNNLPPYDEYKYISTRRRLALFIKSSIYLSSNWVAFEPNGEALWLKIKTNITHFMHTLYQRGAFQGYKPNVAYFVKCGHDTMTQSDISHGIIKILIGFSPEKPNEFIINKIQLNAQH